MKKIEKAVAGIIVSLAMCAGTGCSSVGTVTVSSPTPAQATSQPTAEATDASTATPEATPTASAATPEAAPTISAATPEAAPTASAESTDGAAYEKGTVTNSSFESKFMDLKYALPDGCKMATEDQLKTLMEKACQIAYKDNSDSVIDYINTSCVYEMMSYEGSTNSNVIVLAEKLPIDSITEKQYLDAVKQQLTAQSTEYQFEGDGENVTLFGHEYLGENVVQTQNDHKLVQKYYCRKCGDRMISLILSYQEGQEKMADTLMGGFTQYSK